jgi:hypothetical protein
MSHIGQALVLVAAATCVAGPSSLAQQRPPERVDACSLLPKDEVKKLIGGGPLFDQFPAEEEPLGPSGSACNYAGVMIQVLSFSQGTFDAAKKRGRLEAVTSVGDEAYLYDNPSGYAELYVKVGTRMLTIQRDLDAKATVASVRPAVIALANALVAKLR